MLIGAVVMALGLTMVQPVAWAASPYIASSGATLDGATVTSPFTADLADAGSVTGEVTWLLDDKFAGRDSAAPYQWTVTT
ncbi:hypothetical protein ACWCOZ_28700, partial [Streptomyces sp. NPDC001840]